MKKIAIIAVAAAVGGSGLAKQFVFAEATHQVAKRSGGNASAVWCAYHTANGAKAVKNGRAHGTAYRARKSAKHCSRAARKVTRRNGR